MDKHKPMPILFIGHGSPMNAITENEFTRTLANLTIKMPVPKAILCISAHWLTKGTMVTAMPKPKTIHDFYGFPKALFDIEYPAPGEPHLAQQIANIIKNPTVQADNQAWGLDHGTWSILKYIYPQANIPVLQLSIDIKQNGAFHYNLGQQLQALRSQGILIIGSGNVVHNLNQVKMNLDAQPFEWATTFEAWVTTNLNNKNYDALVSNYFDTPAGQLSVPTPDHYYPLLYILGASENHEKLSIIYSGVQNGSISMLSFGLGL